MRISKPIFVFAPLLLFVSCNSYELTRVQGGAIEKVDKPQKYHVYITAQKSVYKVNKPTFSSAGVSGDIEKVKDAKEADEIKNPSTPELLKSHKHDFNMTIRNPIPDSTERISIKKTDITGYTLVASHSKVPWTKIGNGVAAVVGIAVCLALIGALALWITNI